MKALALQLYAPLESIKEQPWQFAVWWLVANIIGLTGVWLPLLMLYWSDRPVQIAFQNIVYAGSLASFCIVILADGIASNLVARKTGSSQTAVGVRAFLSIIAIILVLITVGIMIAEHSGGKDNHVSISGQIIITVVAILLASYLYCFRFPVLGEKEVDSVREEEDTEVRKLANEAQIQNIDDKGVKL
jgi:hypothetical protein